MEEDDFHKQKTLHDILPGQPVPVPIVIPEKIGPYKIESLLETGGMSQVYLAAHPETKEPVTIKVLLPKFLSHQEVVQRFINEAEIISLADHPNIVKLYSQGQWENGLFIAMEFIQGASLRQFIQHNPLSLKRALEIILEISYALCHLHTHGVIHRDLKLENILMTENGQVKVIDFGIAQVLSDSPVVPTNARPRIIGTPVYMSPEQRENPESVSYPSDIYSLGIIAYELVLGKLSHGHIHLSMMPKGMQKILTKALQPKPSERYQDIVDFIADISSYLNSTMIGKERKTGDQIGEVIEQLQHVQALLLPKSMPQWPAVEIGASYYKSSPFTGLYSDFKQLPNGKISVVLAETPVKTPEGLVYLATFHGLLQALLEIAPNQDKFAEQLNGFVCRDLFDQIYYFSQLILDPQESQAKYLCCGKGNLWKIAAGSTQPEEIPNQNGALGAERNVKFHATVVPWQTGDTFILNNFSEELQIGSGKSFTREFTTQIIQDNLYLTPQKQTEMILRKAKALTSHQLEEQPIAVISVCRHE